MDLKPTGHDLLMRLMSSTTIRRDVLAGNVASQNLPGYRRREVQFEELLLNELQRGRAPEELADIKPKVVIDWDAPARADGNSVSPEEEASHARENRIRFELYAAILRGRTNLVQQAILGER